MHLSLSLAAFYSLSLSVELKCAFRPAKAFNYSLLRLNIDMHIVLSRIVKN